MKVPRRARVPAAAAADVDEGGRGHSVLPGPETKRRDATVFDVAVVTGARRSTPGTGAVQVCSGGGQRGRAGWNHGRRTAGDGRPFQRDSGHEPAAGGSWTARTCDADPGRRLIAGKVLPHRGRRRWRRRRRRHDRRERTDGAETPRKPLGAERRVDLGRVPRTAARCPVRRRRVAVPGRRVQAVGGVVERLAVVQEPGKLVMSRGRRKTSGAFQRHIEVPLFLAPLCSTVLEPNLPTRVHEKI